MISVVLITIRSQPHFDWYAYGLGHQTFKNFEWIVVDDRADTERYTTVLGLSQKYGIKLGYYGRSKPSRWTGKRPALCNARNTAVVVANGQYLAFHDDNGYATSTWLQRYAQWAAFGLCASGTWYTYDHGGLNMQTGAFEGTVGPYGFEHRHEICKVPLPCNGEWLHGGNMGMPIEAPLGINGYDEQYDGEQGVDDCDFGIRARDAGFKIVYDPEALVYYSLDSHFLTQSEVPGVDQKIHVTGSRWERESIAKPPKQKLLLDGKLHHSNEFLIQGLKQGIRPLRANPNFDLTKLREEYRKTLKMEHALGPERDWRDGELIAEMTK